MAVRRYRRVWLAVALMLATAACSRGPVRVLQPRIDPAGAGSAALEQYDKNGDGVINGGELVAAPALEAALPRLDSNKDGGVSADEIAERVNAWKAMRTALASVRCQVTLDGRPLAGAEVTFEPEPFLGEEVKKAVAVTNPFGDAAPTIADEDKPDPSLPGGVYFGLYKVRITKPAGGKETIPARYNTETTLGQEVSYDDPAMKNNNMTFALKTSG